MGSRTIELIALRPFSHSVGSVDAGEIFRAERSYGEELVRAGLASTERPVGRWQGGEAVAIASGPSVTEADIEMVRLWRLAAPNRIVGVTNTTFEKALWADLLYGADDSWWKHYHAQVKEQFAGECWSASDEVRKKYGVQHIQCERRGGVSRIAGVIHHGGNSGYQLAGLLINFGIKRLVLLGYDMQRTGGRSHHHGDHPKPLRQNAIFTHWCDNFREFASDARAQGITLLNCSRATSINAIMRSPLEQALGGTHGR